jgi:hypothetical protein
MRQVARAGAVALLLAVGACSGGGKGSSPSSGSSALNPFGNGASGSGSTASSGAAPVVLRVGQCFDVDVFQSGKPIDPRSVHLSLCAGPHQHEVFATFTYPDVAGAPWPGDDVLDAWAGDHCLDSFSAYVGIEYERSHLDLATVRPDERSWKDSDRAVACAAHDVDFALVSGSIKGTAK